MKNLFKPKIFKLIIIFLMVLLVIKILWFIIEISWLTAIDIDQGKEEKSKTLYYRVKLTPNEAPAPKKIIKPVAQKIISGSIKDITLLAIYNAKDATVVTIEYKNKTKVLSRGDEVKGFILEGAGQNFATFKKSGKVYKVTLIKPKNFSKDTINIHKDISKTTNKIKKNNTVKGNIIDAGDHKLIDRSLLEHYATHMKDIYKNIGIGEVKNGNDLAGFQITFVRSGTPFAKLGIRRGDIIKSINGQEITSYNAALNFYKNLENLENATLVIQRGKEEMELEYEIN